MTQPRDHDAEGASASRGHRDSVRDLAPPTHGEADPYSDDILRRSASHTARSIRNERRASRPSAEYDIPESYRNLDEVYTEPPVQNPDEEPLGRRVSREDDYEGRARRGSRGSGDGGAPLRVLTTRGSVASQAAREARTMRRRRSSAARVAYDVPDAFANLDEVAATSPVENPDEDALYRHDSLEDRRSLEHEYLRDRQLRRKNTSVDGRQGRQVEEQFASTPQEEQLQEKGPDDEASSAFKVSRLATQIYTISYLVLFSIFGTLARLGLQAITTYPGTPVIFSSLWPNFGGSLVMGFLSEDRMLFRYEWGTPTYERQLRKARDDEETRGSGSEQPTTVDIAAAKKAYMATKKTIPLYIGLATGFCGSFTSFSSFMRDVFLALSNDLPTPHVSSIAHRNGGYSFMALLAVIIVTVSLSLAGLFIGAHLAITLEPITPSLPYTFTRKIMDRLAVFLGWGCWLGAILLSALPPDRSNGGTETWRGRATFSLVFAPLGTLARFYASLYLNGLLAAFPVGTFAVNVFGTGIVGMSWDLAHAQLGGVVGCQVLQGVEDGFCGCLTTVSTWVAELTALRRQHAYFYGAASVLAGLAVMVVVMGGLRWTDGFEPLQCTH